MTQEQQLTTLFSNEIECLQGLLGILKQEHDALLKADIEALEQATSSKNAALSAQAESTQSRRHYTVQAGFADTDEGLQQLISNCQNQQELLASFTQLGELARECQTTNRANGRLILQKQQHTREALDIIRQTAPNTPTYSGQGTTTERQGTRTLGKA